jgi:flagellar hook-associated protein 3 FlgL
MRFASRKWGNPHSTIERNSEKTTMMMSIGRIGTNFLSQQSSNWLNRSQVRLNEIQEKVSVGRNIIRPSDDPLGATQVLSSVRNMNEDEQFIRNIANGQSELTTTDNAITQMMSLIQRSAELATQGATVTTGVSGMQALGEEVDLLVNQMVQLGNSTLGENYLFSGFKTNTLPFVRTGDVITYSGTPATEPHERNVQISPDIEVTLNLTGDALLGDTTAGGVFKVMIDLKNALLAGDTALTRTQLDLVKDELNNMLAKQSAVGTSIDQMANTLERTELRRDNTAQLYSKLQDINLPELITDLRFQEQAHETSLGVVGRILPQSLFNFIN